MVETVKTRLLDAFDPRVTAFRSEEYQLSSDLSRLDSVRAAGAAEAVILYCVRAVESMARHVLAPVAVTEDTALVEHIRRLENYGLLPRWLHRLRWMGNEPRHALRLLSDADLALLILLRWLQWYFCDYKKGPGLKSLTVHN